jgi:hypothetical protein
MTLSVVSRSVFFVGLSLSMATGCGPGTANPESGEAPASEAPAVSETAERDIVAQLQALSPRQVTELSDEIQAVRAARPDVSDAELNALVVERIDALLGTSREGIGSLPTNSSSLNPYEQQLCNSNYWACVSTWSAAEQATTYANAYFSSRYHPTLRSDDGTRHNAMKHAFWNAQMVRMVSESWAFDFASAHEYYCNVGNPSNINCADTRIQMDLWNNTKGRNYGVSYRTSTDGVVADAIYAAIWRGEMRVLASNLGLVVSNSSAGY